MTQEIKSWQAIPETCWRGLFAQYREIMQNQVTEAPDNFHFACLATIIGTLIGRRVSVWYARPLYPNFFTVLVGETEKTKKTTAMRFALEIFYALKGFKGKAIPGVSSAEGLLRCLGAYIVEKEAERTGYDCILWLEELAALLRKGRQEAVLNLPPMITHLYDLPKEVELPTRKQPLRLLNPFLSILSGTTLEWLQSSIREEELLSGFANRFLYITGVPKPPIPLPRKPDLSPIIREISSIQPFWEAGASLSLSASAIAEWDAFYSRWRRWQPTGTLAAIVGRIPEYTMKLALLYAVLERKHEISGEMMKAACDFAYYLYNSYAELFGFFPLEYGARIEASIISYLKEQNPRRVSEIHHKISGRVRADVLRRILQGLEDLEIITIYQDSQGKTWVKLIKEDNGLTKMAKNVK